MSTSFNNDIRKFRAHERGEVVGRKLDLIADLARRDDHCFKVFRGFMEHRGEELLHSHGRAAANIDEHLGYHHEIRVDVDIPAPRLNNCPPHGRINTTEREACERKCDFEDIECGLTEEGAVTEASRCLRCDHFGYGIFRGGRDIKW